MWTEGQNKFVIFQKWQFSYGQGPSKEAYKSCSDWVAYSNPPKIMAEVTFCPPFYFLPSMRVESTSICMVKQPCLRMFFLPSFIKRALCFCLIVSGRAVHADRPHQHPSIRRIEANHSDRHRESREVASGGCKTSMTQGWWVQAEADSRWRLTDFTSE